MIFMVMVTTPFLALDLAMMLQTMVVSFCIATKIGSPCFMPDPGECDSSPSAAVGASDSKCSTCRDLGEQPVLTETQHDALFSRCLLTNCDFVGIKMPWEEGIYKEIFSSEPLPQFPVPQMEISGFCSLELGMEPPPLSTLKPSST